MALTRAFSCVLITGASAGLGEEFARQLAPRAGSLVLVARRTDLLESLAAEIRAKNPETSITVLTADLKDAQGRARLLDALRTGGLVPDLLINNAGLGDYGEFATAEWEKLDSMLQVNVAALTHLTRALLPGIINTQGAIVNVSSLASLVPMPDFAVYAATKAYVTSFSEALRIEMKPHGVRVLALCPGPVKTGFGKVSRRTPEAAGMPARKAFYVPKEQVISETLSALARNRPRVYPALKTAVAARLMSATPTFLVRLLMGLRPKRNR